MVRFRDSRGRLVGTWGLVATLFSVSMSAAEWRNAFAEQLDIDPPSDDERDAILALAGVAAHASERTAAPIACWLAARAGVTTNEARSLAMQIVVPDVDDELRP